MMKEEEPPKQGRSTLGLVVSGVKEMGRMCWGVDGEKRKVRTSNIEQATKLCCKKQLGI